MAPPRVIRIPVKTYGIADASTYTPPAEASKLVSSLLDIIEEASPLPASRRKDIRHDVLELWRELTSEKSTRQADYIGEPARLAAYLRYFLPWNVVRLAPILAKLDLGLSSGDAILDIGSGPLTVPIALWIARPDLRDMELRIDCVDRVRRVMELGSTILEGLALRAGQPFKWKITIKKDNFSIQPDEAEHDKYALVTAANVFNESFWHIKGSLSERAGDLATSLGANLSPGGRMFIVEPGDPRSGAMLSALRESIIERGGRPLAPCPHDSACPMAGAFLSRAFRRDEDDDQSDDGQSPERTIAPVVTARGRSKAPWCHFVLDSGAAPERLITFSESAGLPKDRLIASWLLLQPKPPTGATLPFPSDRAVRIVSDAFRLPDGGAGRYACTKTGYALARGSLSDLPSGALAVLDGPIPPSAGERDIKSSAVIIRAHSASIAPVVHPVKAPKAPRDASPVERRDERTPPSRPSSASSQRPFRSEAGRSSRPGDDKDRGAPSRTRYFKGNNPKKTRKKKRST